MPLFNLQLKEGRTKNIGFTVLLLIHYFVKIKVLHQEMSKEETYAFLNDSILSLALQNAPLLIL
jgi:hypothetical protein